MRNATIAVIAAYALMTASACSSHVIYENDGVAPDAVSIRSMMGSDGLDLSLFGDEGFVSHISRTSEWASTVSSVRFDEYDYASVLSDSELGIYRQYIAAASIRAAQHPEDPRSIWLLNTEGVDYQVIFDIIELASFDDPVTSIYHTNNANRITLYISGDAFLASSSATNDSWEIDEMIADVDARAAAIADTADGYAASFYDASMPDEDASIGLEAQKAWIRAVFHQVVANADYDSSDEEELGLHANDIYGCLVEGRTLCGGYSEAIKYLLDRKGFPNFIASGVITGDEASRHAFNVVRLGDAWYAIDATMDSYDPLNPKHARRLEPGSTDFRASYSGCLVPLYEYAGDVGIVYDDATLRLMSSLQIS